MAHFGRLQRLVGLAWASVVDPRLTSIVRRRSTIYDAIRVNEVLAAYARPGGKPNNSWHLILRGYSPFSG